MLKDCFNYSGNKYKLLPQLLEEFPKEINTFVDVFTGGACVALNTTANRYILNDKNHQLMAILKCFSMYSEEEILNNIESYIDIFGLSKEGKEEFLIAREAYNDKPLLKTDPSPHEEVKIFIRAMLLYCLITHSFNNFIHFNSKGEFSVPNGTGKCYFNPSLRSRLIDCVRRLKEMRTQYLSADYKKIIDTLLSHNKLTNKDFVFVDPPYILSDSSYNRIGYLKWTEEEEKKLYGYLDKLNENEIRFGLTNILQRGDKTNKYLEEFSKKYHVVELKSDYKNCNYQKQRVETVEIFVRNYSI